MKSVIRVIGLFMLVFTGIGIAGADGGNGNDRRSDFESRHARLATVAIPCVADGLRFSCSNKSSRRPLLVLDAKCIVGAGDDPEVQSLFGDGGEVAPEIEIAPETTEVAFVFCSDVPVPAFCTARVFPRQNARCALTSPAGGLNAELK